MDLTKETGWHKLEAGRYVRLISGVRFEVEYDPEMKRWYARRNGIVFDAARTMREARDYCEEPPFDGKPLTEIL